MIDENFKVWLIEVNTNPCLELSSPLLGKIIPNMLENALRIAVDPLFAPSLNILLQNKKYLIFDNSFEFNKFELVFDELEDGKYLKKLLDQCIKIFNKKNLNFKLMKWNKMIKMNIQNDYYIY